MPPARSRPRRELDESMDLRRRFTADHAQALADRAECCLPDDRALVHALLRQGLSPKEIAELRSIPASTMYKRLKALVNRLNSPRFEFVLRHRDAWTPTRRRVATACVLEGRTLRGTATHLGVTLYTVRREMDAISALIQEASAKAA